MLITSSIDSSDLDAPILNSEIQSIERDLGIVQSLVIPQTPAIVILEEANLINNTISVDEVLNSDAPFDNEPSRSEVLIRCCKRFLTLADKSNEKSTNDIQENQDQNPVLSVSDITHSLSEIPDKLYDPYLRPSIADVMSCVTNLKKNSSDKSNKSK